MDNDYLIKKPPLQALFLFALPMIIGNLFQQTYTMVDSAIVGRYVSEQALAAVGASYALTNIFICVAIGGGIGASVIVSRYFGAKEYGRMKTAVFTALLSFLGISLVLGIAGLILGKQIMIWLNTPADCLDMASEYLRIYFLGLPFLSNKVFCFPSSPFRFLRRTPKERTADIPWAISVAQATPATPISIFVTMIMSRITLNMEEKIRKYRGILDFPSALNIAEDLV